MNVDDLILVSVDDHVIEPAHMFEGRVPKKYQDEAPRFVRRDDGTMAWRYKGQEILNPALNAVAGRPPEEFGAEPTCIEEIRSGCYDIGDRVKDMNANGVLGSMCFPSFPRFCGQLFWSRRTRTRPPLWSAPTTTGTSRTGRHVSGPDHSPCTCRRCGTPTAAAAEIRRVADKGCHAVTFSSSPLRSSGCPACTRTTGIRSGRPAPMRAPSSACTSGRPPGPSITSPDAPIDLSITLSPMDLVHPRPPICCGAGVPEVPRPCVWRCPRVASAGCRTSSSGSTTSTRTTSIGLDRTSATAPVARSSTST